MYNFIPKNIINSERFLNKFIQGNDNDCWNWNGAINMYGYGFITIKNKIYLAHRVSYTYFKNEFDSELLVCHKCDNRKCINPNHLFLGTQKDNITDMMNKGRGRTTILRGELNGRSKITNQQVEEIREIYSKEKITYTELGKRYDLSYRQISNIINKRSWNNALTEERDDEVLEPSPIM